MIWCVDRRSGASFTTRSAAREMCATASRSSTAESMKDSASIAMDFASVRVRDVPERVHAPRTTESAVETLVTGTPNISRRGADPAHVALEVRHQRPGAHHGLTQQRERGGRGLPCAGGAQEQGRDGVRGPSARRTAGPGTGRGCCRCSAPGTGRLAAPTTEPPWNQAAGQGGHRPEVVELRHAAGVADDELLVEQVLVPGGVQQRDAHTGVVVDQGLVRASRRSSGPPPPPPAWRRSPRSSLDQSLDTSRMRLSRTDAEARHRNREALCGAAVPICNSGPATSPAPPRLPVPRRRSCGGDVAAAERTPPPARRPRRRRPVGRCSAT